MHLQLRHSNAPLAFQSFIAASMNPNGVQYEMRGPIMKYKNRNKHSFPRLWAVEYSPLFPFSSFALTSVLRERLNYFTYFLIKVTLRNMSASILCRRKLVEIVWWVIWICQYFSYHTSNRFSLYHATAFKKHKKYDMRIFLLKKPL